MMASRSKAPFGGFLTVLLLFAVIAQGSLASASGEFALVGGRILLPDGSLAEGKAVVIGIAGKIERIIPAADIGELPKKVLPEGSVLSPGLHDLLGGFGAGEAVERTRLFDPEVRAVEAVDSTSETLTLARGYGVLHATVAPAPVNLPVNFAVNCCEPLWAGGVSQESHKNLTGKLSLFWTPLL